MKGFIEIELAGLRNIIPIQHIIMVRETKGGNAELLIFDLADPVNTGLPFADFKKILADAIK